MAEDNKIDVHEMYLSYRQSLNKKEQIKIISQLNLVDCSRAAELIYNYIRENNLERSFYTHDIDILKSYIKEDTDKLSEAESDISKQPNEDKKKRVRFSKDQIEKVSSCIERGLGCKETVEELTTSQLEKNQISALYYRLKKKEAPATKVKEETADGRFIKCVEKDLQDVNNLLLKANRELE